ncbi:MAG TPA: beta-ketoacyl synthase N-terminal-like domain-containing protein [Nostocaceae cyanobacterium]|nr:beta-ketoacyl synthase N-terminal-like domain-containing protein [Nostocaceae cyanobacterium]
MSNISQIEVRLQNKIAAILEIPTDEVYLSASPSELGFDSLNYVELTTFLQSEFKIPVTPDLLYECHTITALAEFIQQNLEPSLDTNTQEELAVAVIAEETSTVADVLEYESSPQDIAIIGIGLSLPQAKNLEEFWQLLTAGKCSIADFPAQRLPENTEQRNLLHSPELSPFLKGGFMADVECFDARFFGISPREAQLMDPQQRIFLQCVWHAIENAGYRASELSGSKTAVLVGASSFDYHELLCQQENSVEPHLGTGVSHAVLANRISHLLNLKGASEAIDTACSSSLVAINRAVELLRSGKCDLAIAGGVSVITSLTSYVVFSKAGMLSKTGECSPFDERANGYVRGEGAGALLLKPLTKAERDGDYIYAVIKGAAVGHSGHTNSLTAPAPEAQAETILAAYADAQVSPATLGYIEAHGTGTTLGDPIEINGLKKVFATVETSHNCYVGSVKSNIGHLEAAAGVGGIIKSILALQKGVIPANANFSTLNKYIRLDNSPLQIASQPVTWERQTTATGKPQPRRAGVSSFGFGGTNAHVVIEEYLARTVNIAALSQPQLVVLSAKSKERLTAYAHSIARFLAQHNNFCLADIAYTLQKGREAMEHRLAIVVNTVEELGDALHKFITGKLEDSQTFVGDSSHRQAYEELFEHQQELEEHVRSLAQKSAYPKLAKLWVGGLDIDWAKVLPRDDSAAVVPLPGYPFSPDKYWVPETTTVPAKTIKVPAKEHISLLVPQWQHQALPKDSQATLQGKIIVLASDDIKPLIATLQAQHRQAAFVVVENGSTYTQITPQHYQFCFDHADHRARFQHETASLDITGILDLTANSQSIFGNIALLQSLLNTRKPLRLLQVTQGLQNINGTSTNLGGAELAGLFKMLGAEYNSCYAKTLDLDPKSSDLATLSQIIAQEYQADDQFTEICYRDGDRFVATLVPLNYQPTHSQNLPQGTVVITGGTGGIGNEVAQHLARQGYKTLVLMGKTPLPPRTEWAEIIAAPNPDPAIASKITNILKLEKQGVTVELYTGELTDYTALDVYFQNIRRQYGRITHVFHCAGCVSSTSPAFVHKSLDSITSVFLPKITTLKVLHKIFKHDHLNAFILFSSVSSIVPKLAVGISDYATANAYMNYFAAYQVAQGYTYYRAIQWSNWKEVGMGQLTSQPMTKIGIVPLSTSGGLQSLDTILTLPPQIHTVACVGSQEQLNLSELPLVAKTQTATQFISSPKLNTPTDGNALRTYVLESLSQILSRELHIALDQIDYETTFDALGVDSIFLASIVNKIDQWLGLKLDPSLLLQHNSISRLAQHLITHHHEQLQPKLPTLQPQIVETKAKSPTPLPLCTSTPVREQNSAEIAVIGIACKFPGAANKEIFWNNLVAGVDSIREIPKTRWDVAQHYSREFTSGKSISKWGGFIDDLEYIDPTMFGVSQNEASDIDPLVRLFCQSCVEAVVDSGYTIKDVNHRKVGVFVGARVAGYGDRIQVPKKSSVVGVGQNFIASHVSHYLNLKGPSLVIDTACSSSLMAIHLACQSLLQGESEMALAGGVEVLLDEKPYLFLSAAHALSPDGKCFTFDERANGFVPGEGVGCVLLKPLKQALADGDPIYAVINATAANNDGHTMGITTPSVEGQVEVVTTALAKANISPNQITYIETHGTATMIGDPIELRALSQVFAEVGTKHHCALGSVKTNIGHLLSAAGVASFIKVALSLHHQIIPPSLHCEQLNPRFDFANSPFYPAQTTQPWNPTQPKFAGISSFGFGGTNVHTILSEPPKSAVKPGAKLVTQGLSSNKIWAWLPAAQNVTSVCTINVDNMEKITPLPRRSLLTLELENTHQSLLKLEEVVNAAIEEAIV